MVAPGARLAILNPDYELVAWAPGDPSHDRREARQCRAALVAARSWDTVARNLAGGASSR